MGKRLILENLTLPLTSQTQCFLFNGQLLWSYDRILQSKILNSGSLGWGLKNFGPKYLKAHPYAKTGRINRLA